MTMTFLPIVARELRVAARRSSTYWSRFQVTLGALVPTIFLIDGPFRFAPAAEKGARTFQVLAFVGFLSVLLAAVRLTADCLSSEKRDGTLGLLFLTDLKPYDVVLGKLAATSLNAVLGLLALMPVLAIPILLGGVTLADLSRLGLVLFNCLFFAVSLAMLISALNWQEKKAEGITVLLLLAIGAGLPLAGAFVASLSGPASSASVLSMAGPGFACLLVPSAAYRLAPGAFWFSTGVTHAAGWLFLLLTFRILPRVWQDRPAGARRLRWREFARRALMGGDAARVAFRTRWLAVNPVGWLACRARRTCWYPWIFLASMALIGGISCSSLRVRSVEFGTLFFFSFFLNWFFKHWVINQACHAFSTDRDQGALELLLSSPLRVEDVLRGHWMAMRRQFLAPILAVIAIELICFGLAVSSLNETWARQDLFWVVIFPASLVVFAADLVAASWVGFWAGMMSKNAASAVSRTYFRVMLLPWLAVMAGLLARMAGLLPGNAYLFGIAGIMIIPVALVLWVPASLAADLVFARRARRSLCTEMRLAAVERYSGGDPAMLLWKRLGRGAASGNAAIRFAHSPGREHQG